MSVQYVKRLQMAFDFATTPLPALEIPAGFRCVPWETKLLRSHADVKHRSFRDDLDGRIFPTFRDFDRCLRLMEAISSHSTFLPQATLLIATDPLPCETNGGFFEFVANIQGMRPDRELGAIQNVAVLPDYRRQKLGRALLLGSLHGFRKAGVRRVTLEVTAENVPAVRLYENLGFETFKAYFREIYQ